MKEKGEVYKSYSSQMFWIAKVLLGQDGLSRIGFRYLPDIPWYNHLMKRHISVKNFKFSNWLISLLNVETNVTEGTAVALQRANKLGLDC